MISQVQSRYVRLKERMRRHTDSHLQPEADGAEGRGEHAQYSIPYPPRSPWSVSPPSRSATPTPAAIERERERERAKSRSRSRSRSRSPSAFNPPIVMAGPSPVSPMDLVFAPKEAIEEEENSRVHQEPMIQEEEVPESSDPFVQQDEDQDPQYEQAVDQEEDSYSAYDGEEHTQSEADQEDIRKHQAPTPRAQSPASFSSHSDTYTLGPQQRSSRSRSPSPAGARASTPKASSLSPKAVPAFSFTPPTPVTVQPAPVAVAGKFSWAAIVKGADEVQAQEQAEGQEAEHDDGQRSLDAFEEPVPGFDVTGEDEYVLDEYERVEHDDDEEHVQEEQEQESTDLHIAGLTTGYSTSTSLTDYDDMSQDFQPQRTDQLHDAYAGFSQGSSSTSSSFPVSPLSSTDDDEMRRPSSPIATDPPTATSFSFTSPTPTPILRTKAASPALSSSSFNSQPKTDAIGMPLHVSFDPALASDSSGSIEVSSSSDEDTDGETGTQSSVLGPSASGSSSVGAVTMAPTRFAVRGSDFAASNSSSEEEEDEDDGQDEERPRGNMMMGDADDSDILPPGIVNLGSLPVVGADEADSPAEEEQDATPKVSRARLFRGRGAVGEEDEEADVSVVHGPIPNVGDMSRIEKFDDGDESMMSLGQVEDVDPAEEIMDQTGFDQDDDVELYGDGAVDKASTQQQSLEVSGDGFPVSTPRQRPTSPLSTGSSFSGAHAETVPTSLGSAQLKSSRPVSSSLSSSRSVELDAWTEVAGGVHHADDESSPMDVQDELFAEQFAAQEDEHGAEEEDVVEAGEDLLDGPIDGEAAEAKDIEVESVEDVFGNESDSEEEVVEQVVPDFEPDAVEDGDGHIVSDREEPHQDEDVFDQGDIKDPECEPVMDAGALDLSTANATGEPTGLPGDIPTTTTRTCGYDQGDDDDAQYERQDESAPSGSVAGPYGAIDQSYELVADDADQAEFGAAASPISPSRAGQRRRSASRDLTIGLIAATTGMSLSDSFAMDSPPPIFSSSESSTGSASPPSFMSRQMDAPVLGGHLDEFSYRDTPVSQVFSAPIDEEDADFPELPPLPSSPTHSGMEEEERRSTEHSWADPDRAFTPQPASGPPSPTKPSSGASSPKSATGKKGGNKSGKSPRGGGKKGGGKKQGAGKGKLKW
ncbi:hypothetical protein BCR44DRAFT_1427540 [Catenaria anguillulae PL171]|uniref:Uncharacterized protein n=1 Tax=Catenaria anguillulae PL171 TaxID=765915 RepID=A0A1Y2I1I1_9FUNG|nr:hypothetical protein BCR44DRAFT_1427540 [Catenaria anguillulae PL171]